MFNNVKGWSSSSWVCLVMNSMQQNAIWYAMSVQIWCWLGRWCMLETGHDGQHTRCKVCRLYCIHISICIVSMIQWSTVWNQVYCLFVFCVQVSRSKSGLKQEMVYCFVYDCSHRSGRDQCKLFRILPNKLERWSQLSSWYVFLMLSLLVNLCDKVTVSFLRLLLWQLCLQM